MPTPLSVPTASITGDETSVTMTLDVTGGTRPYRATAYESLEEPSQHLPGLGIPTTLVEGETVAGAGPITFAVPPGGGRKYAKVLVTDSAGQRVLCPGIGETAAGVFGKAVAADIDQWTWHYLEVSAWGKPVHVVRVGDSTTSMSRTAYASDPAFAAALSDLLGLPTAVTVTNLGVSGSTAADWQSGGGNYAAIVPALRAGCRNVVSVMLGMNDVRGGAIQGLSGRIDALCAAALADADAAGMTDTLVVVHNMTPRPFFAGADDYRMWSDARDDIRDNVTYGVRVARGSSGHAALVASRLAIIDDVHLSASGDRAVYMRQAAAIAALVAPP